MSRLEEARKYVRQHITPDEDKPRFHVTPEVGWMNDPNGFSVYQGSVHLFYQFYPYRDTWGPTHWGHVKTKDMIHWEYLPVALAPDLEADESGCFSGSALTVDDQHVLMYTGASGSGERSRQNQSIAFGDGLEYKKESGNPVISGESLPDGFSVQDFRDPKIWWENGIYYAIAGNLNSYQLGQIVLFESKDLKNWRYKSVFAENDGSYGRMWECPDFFSIGASQFLIVSPQDMEARGYEFHPGNNALYFPGSFDRESGKFNCQEAYSLDYGLDFYAPQTAELEDGRRILIAWARSWDSDIKPAGQKWNGMMTIPRELSVVKGKLFQKPVRELEKYYKNHLELPGYEIQGANEAPVLHGRCMDLTLDLSGNEYEKFRVSFACDANHHTDFIYNRTSGMVEYDRTYSGVRRDTANGRKMKTNHNGGNIKLRFVMDYYSIELFVNDGEQCFTATYYTPRQADGICMSCDGKAVVNIKKDDIIA